MHKDGKWAREILAAQREDGSWGQFHSLATSRDEHFTTEQALRRLRVLGFTAEDAPIQRALAYMESCLMKEQEIPDPKEKLHNWDLFCDLMLATNIRLFRDDCVRANEVAAAWGRVLTGAFASGAYRQEDYREAYIQELGILPRGGRLVDYISFYPVALLPGELDADTERRMVAHILQNPTGVYYLYQSALNILPDFHSRNASFYLYVIELLTRYEHSRDLLQFVVDWLLANRQENGRWDMGKTAKDGTYFPLSDNWRTKELREQDCTERIERLLSKWNMDR